MKLFQLPSTDLIGKQSSLAAEESVESSPRGSASVFLEQNGDEPEEEVELPPPMKPIQEPLLGAAAVSAADKEDAQGKRVS